MAFLVAGLNHRTAPLEIRERLAVTEAQLPEAIKAMRGYLNQGIILSTCNRSEVYTVGTDDCMEEGIQRFLTGYFNVSAPELDRYLFSYRHEECIGHLFRVASSLDSMILGEGQILRQVKDAFDAAVQAKAAGGPLSRLFSQALRVGKRVRRETGISRNALSVSRACVELARRLLGDLRQLRVVVIGTGDAGELAVRALKKSGVSDVVVTNRTFDRAAELARELGAEAVPFEQMPNILESADIVISSTGSPGYILEAEAVRRAMAIRPQRPMFLIDIAVPRDIDPSTAQLSNVFLHDVDDLQTISEANRLEREREAGLADEIVTHEICQFLEWYGALDAIPTITTLRQEAEEIRERELAKLFKRLDHKLTAEELGSIETMTQALVKKLLHNPTAYLKEQRSPEKLRMARELFNLQDEAP